jgi:transposase
MTTGHRTTAAVLPSASPATWVAIDIAKDAHVVLIESGGKRQQRRLPNALESMQQFIAHLQAQPQPVRIAFEPTGMYHRPLAYRLVTAGFDVCMVSSVTCARYREARYGSWDKNDPKDARVILEVMQQGMTMRYVDPLLAGWHDVQEVAKTYWQVTLARTRVQHSLLTHFLPIYWPEFARYWRTSRSAQFITLLLAYPTPASITAVSCDEFVAAAWGFAGRKVAKRAWLTGVYELAQHSVALPIALDSVAVTTFRMRLQAFLDLSAQRAALEAQADALLGANSDYHQLQTIPGIGPVFALTILAEAGDIRRFAHHRQFLKFCGLDLAKNQSGQQRGLEQLSKRGNNRLRAAFWFAGRIAVRSTEHSVRAKYERYVASEPFSPARKRKAYTAIAAKMARITHAVIKTGRPYRGYFEHELPSGSIPLNRAVEAPATS